MADGYGLRSAIRIRPTSKGGMRGAGFGGRQRQDVMEPHPRSWQTGVGDKWFTQEEVVHAIDHSIKLFMKQVYLRR